MEREGGEEKKEGEGQKRRINAGRGVEVEK